MTQKQIGIGNSFKEKSAAVSRQFNCRDTPAFFLTLSIYFVILCV